MRGRLLHHLPKNAKQLGHGQGYEYSHDAPDGIAAQDYLGVEKRYYEPTDRGLERDLAERLAEIRRRLSDRRPDADAGGSTHDRGLR